MVSVIRVLHVDDDPIILDISKSILELYGEFTVTTVSSATEAIRLLEQGEFDSIVSDYQMPEMDGIEFLVEVRSHFGSIPFILFTGKGREEVVIQAINRGADFYLQKGGDTDAQFAELAHKIKQGVSRKIAEESLREHDERISLLLNSTAEAIYGLDMNGNCTFCNSACLRLLRYKHPDELLGKNMHWQIHAKHPDGTHFPIEDCRIFQAVNKGEGTHVEDEVLWRSDGTSFPAEYWSHPQIHNGKVVGAVVTFLDITERKGLENEVNYTVQKLKNFSMSLAAANRKLTLLSSITRHDILNQLTVLMGYLSLLEIKQRDSTLKEYCIKSTTAAEKISTLIKFTKEYDEIEAHAPAWQGDCCTLVDTAAKETMLGQVKVINDLPAGLEIFADPLISKVFNNLMDNAVRYGEKITTIRFSVKESGDDQVIVCEDDGDGVVAEEKEKIFERGYKKKNEELGLFLSREILAITGIMIIENGTPDKGSRFEIRVPNGMYRFTGIKTEDFTGQSDNNALPIPPPVVTGATTNAAGTVITVRFNKVMNNPAGKHAEFKYRIGSGPTQSFSAAALNADPTKIDLTTSGTPISYGDRIKVSYTGTDITATDGGVLESFGSPEVYNAMPVPPPPVVTGATTNAAGTVITIRFNKAMNNPAGKHAEFKYRIGSGPTQSFSAAALNADPTKIDLTTSGTPIAHGDRVKLSYTGTDITAIDGGVLKRFGNPSDDNAMPAPAPVVTGAMTNAAGTVITIRFNKVMNNPAGKYDEFKYRIGSGLTQSFSAAALNADRTKIDLITSGTPIAYGDTVTVSYTGTDITAADTGVLATFTNHAVTNNVPGDIPMSSLSAPNADPTKIIHGSLRKGQYQQILNGIIILFLIVNVMIIFSLVSERSQTSSVNPVNITVVSTPNVSPASTIIIPAKTITPTPKPTPTPVPAEKGYVNIFYMSNKTVDTSLASIYLNLVNPPLIIDFNVIPQNVTDLIPLDYKVMSTVHHDILNVSRPSEDAKFTVAVKYRDGGGVVAEDGYGGIYSIQTPKRLIVRTAGNYTIQAEGEYVNATLSMQIPKEGNLPA